MTHQYTKELRIFCHENHDKCSKCGYEFKEGDTTHLGYLDNRDYAYLCDRCSNLLIETVARYYFKKRPYQIPHQTAKLWRYMDFSKYVSLLNRKSLYFSSVSKFKDVFEGAKGVLSRENVWNEYYYNFFSSAIRNPPEGYTCNKNDDEIKQDASRLLMEMKSHSEDNRNSTFINCWHENTSESEAMWKLYSKDITNAICVQSTYESLYLCLGRNPDISIGRVNYINYSNEFAPVNASYWYKRKSFIHEQEVRAVINSIKNKGSSGLYIKVDLDVLIKSVYISPSAPNWFREVVQDINEKYDVKVPIMQSSLLTETPFY